MSPDPTPKSLQFERKLEDYLSIVMINYLKEMNESDNKKLLKGYSANEINEKIKLIAKSISKINYQHWMLLYIKNIINETFNIEQYIPSNNKDYSKNYNELYCKISETESRKKEIREILESMRFNTTMSNPDSWLTMDHINKIDRNGLTRDQYIKLGVKETSNKIQMAKEALHITLQLLQHKKITPQHHAKTSRDTLRYDTSKNPETTTIEQNLRDKIEAKNEVIEKSKKEIISDKNKLPILEKDKKKNAISIGLSIIFPCVILPIAMLSIFLLPIPLIAIIALSVAGATSFIPLVATLNKRRSIIKEEKNIQQKLSENIEYINDTKKTQDKDRDVLQLISTNNLEEMLDEDTAKKTMLSLKLNENIQQTEATTEDSSNSNNDNLDKDLEYHTANEENYDTANESIYDESDEEITTHKTLNKSTYNALNEEMNYDTFDERANIYKDANESGYDASDEEIDLEKERKVTKRRIKNRTSYQTIDSTSSENSLSEQEHSYKDNLPRSIKEKRRLNDNISITSIEKLSSSLNKKI